MKCCGSYENEWAMRISSIRECLDYGDTIACMTGSIAENYYGVPGEIKEDVLKYILDYMLKVINELYEKKKVKMFLK